MSSLNQAELIKLLVAQCRSADLWIDCWEKYKDAASMKNAAMAIGKIHGIYGVLLVCNGSLLDMPQHVFELMTKYQRVWDNLTFPSRPVELA